MSVLYLDCELHTFIFFFLPFGGTVWLEWAELGMSSLPCGRPELGELSIALP